MVKEEEITDEEREYVAGKLAHVERLLRTTARIAEVCRDILDHFEAKIAPTGMKAQVIAFDRELIVAYKNELSRLIAERFDGEGRLDEAQHLLDPNIGALTQIVEQYKPDNTPVIVPDLVRNIDSIAKQVAYSEWNESQPGDRAAGLAIRAILKKCALPVTGPPVRQRLRLNPGELLTSRFVAPRG